MQVTIQNIPNNLDEFKSLAEMGITKPENTCVLLLCALNLFDKNNDEGTAAMNMLRGPKPLVPYDVQFLRDRLRGKSYLPKAYFEGATPENGYTPAQPYTLNVLSDSRPQDEEGYLKVFLKTAGADSPRPVKLRKKGSTGEWFVWDYTSLLVGIRTPTSEDPWA